MGAVCSKAPVTSRPRGPRKARSVPDTVPKVSRHPPPAMATAVATTLPNTALAAGSKGSGDVAPVSTDTTARSPSASTPATVPTAVSPSAKCTVTSDPRRLCAFVTTVPSATTMPAPRPQPRPMRTTAGATRSAMAAAALCVSELVTVMLPPALTLLALRMEDSNLQSTSQSHVDRALGVPSPLEAALTRVGDRWSLLLVEGLLDGPRRFKELHAALPGVASNILSQRLRRLEQEGVVVATPYSHRPVRYAYELSAAGRELAGVLRLLARWGAAHAAPRFDGGLTEHAACGSPLEARWYCPTCERVVSDGDAEGPIYL